MGLSSYDQRSELHRKLHCVGLETVEELRDSFFATRFASPLFVLSTERVAEQVRESAQPVVWDAFALPEMSEDLFQ